MEGYGIKREDKGRREREKVKGEEYENGHDKRRD